MYRGDMFSNEFLVLVEPVDVNWHDMPCGKAIVPKVYNVSGIGRIEDAEVSVGDATPEGLLQSMTSNSEGRSVSLLQKFHCRIGRSW